MASAKFASGIDIGSEAGRKEVTSIGKARAVKLPCSSITLRPTCSLTGANLVVTNSIVTLFSFRDL